jgi:hypothetical protein
MAYIEGATLHTISLLSTINHEQIIKVVCVVCMEIYIDGMPMATRIWSKPVSAARTNKLRYGVHGCAHGDQMSSWKNRPVCSPTISCKNEIMAFKVEKSSSNIRATFVIFQNLTKVNNRRIGENSPNLVTLVKHNWRNQGCQMVCFQTKDPSLGKFWRAYEW